MATTKKKQLKTPRKPATAKRARGKLAPGGKARGLDAGEVAIAMDSAEIADVVCPGAQRRRRAHRRLSRTPRWAAAAHCLAAARRPAAHALSTRSVAHAREAPGPEDRRDGSLLGSADRGARRGRPVLDTERPTSAGSRKGTRTEADHGADLTGRDAGLSHSCPQHREGA